MKVTVNETQSNEIDWSKNPQLVVSETGVIVKVLQKQEAFSEDCFSGHCLNNEHLASLSIHSWSKSDFKPFHGSITLSND